MTKISLLLSALLLSQTIAKAQQVQATLVNGHSANAVKIRVKNITASPVSGYMSSLVFSLRVPDQGPIPTITATSLMTDSGSITYPPPYVEGSYRYYDVSVVFNGNNPVNLPANGELDVFSVSLSNGVLATEVQMVGKEFSGPGSAGPNNSTEYYLAVNGNDMSLGANRFYDNGVNSVNLSNSPTISVVGLGSGLPVAYTHFEAKKESNDVMLSWGTATENNNLGFDIERSTDGKSFLKIGHRQSKAVNGNSSTKLEYTFSDNQPVNGMNYYRLKQINKDGKLMYSNITSVLFNQTDAVILYPNPANDKITIDVAGVKSIEMYSVSGQKVNVPVSYGNNSHELNLKGLSNGNYVIKIVTATGLLQQKVIVRH